MSSLRKNVASQVVTFCMVNATTGAALTGASVTATVAKDGTQGAGGGTVTELGSGQYKYVPSQSDTNATNVGMLFTATNAIPVNLNFYTDNWDTTQPVVTSGSGTDQLTVSGGIASSDAKKINAVSTSSVTTVNANQGTTQPINFTGTAGSALAKSDMVDVAGSAVSATTAQLGVNVVNWNNTVVATPATAGIPDINVKNMNNVAATSITTINASQGTTQPVNFTGTAGSALVKTDVIDIAGTASAGTAGYVGIDWGHVNAPTTTVGLTGTTIATSQVVASVTGAVGSVTGAVGSVTARVTANTDQLAGQTVTAAAGVTFPASVASPTNITAGTITTATNLTNAPTNGDFTAAMKTSLNAATPASVTGAVGSVTGNVGGNVTGSVGSISGITFPTNFGALGISAAGKISEVVLTDTVTTYTGNTPQTGDGYAALVTTAFAESAAVPAASATLKNSIIWLKTLSRNKITQTATTETLYADDGSTSVSTSTDSDNGTTFVRGVWS